MKWAIAVMSIAQIVMRGLALRHSAPPARAHVRQGMRAVTRTLSPTRIAGCSCEVMRAVLP